MTPLFQQFRDLVIQPTHSILATVRPGLDSPSATMLMLDTWAQESQGQYIAQLGGPALGFGQIEPNTEQLVLGWLVKNDPELRALVLDFRADQPSNQLVNPFYNCAIGRCLYWSAPEPLPAPDDLNGLWLYYKNHYNSLLGAATQDQFLSNHATYVA